MFGKGLFDKIKAEVDFSPVLKTVIMEEGMESKEKANELLDAFLQWFSLIPSLREGQRLQMIRGVDPIWHSFILNTKFYREFCEKYIGEFIDHDPMDVDLEEGKEEYANFTLTLLKNEFGAEVNPKLLLLEEGATCCAGCKNRTHLARELQMV